MAEEGKIKGTREIDIKKKESKNKLSAVNREMDLAEVVGGGDADGVGRGGCAVPVHRINTQEGSSDSQDSSDTPEILANS